MASRRAAKQTVLALILLAGAGPLVAHDAPPPPRTVAVNGEGEVSTKPDRARLNLGVDQLSPDVKAAETEVNKVVRAYLAEAKSLGAKDEQLQTTGVSIQPEYTWDEKTRQQKLVGYRVRREISVAITDLDKLGDYLLRATKVGVNQVNPPALESSKAKEFENQALVKAAEDARARAKLLTDTLNVKLGPVRSISANQAEPPPPIRFKAMAVRAEAADGNAEMGISLGEIRYRASVEAEFDLVP